MFGLSMIRSVPLLFAVLIGFGIVRPVTAQSTYYWNSASSPATLWSNTANWWTTDGGATNPATPPGASELVQFNSTGVNGPTTVQIDAATSVLGMTFANSGTTLLDSSSTTSNTLTLGASGITINAGAGAVTLGHATNLMPIAISASQSWTNNASTTLTVVNGINTSTAGTQLLTVGGSGNTTFSGVLSNGTGTLALTKSGAGNLTLTGLNTYTGATTVSQGVLTLQNSGAISASVLASAVTIGGSGSINGIKTNAGFANRGNLTTQNISGSGTITINNAANSAGTSNGGWLIIGNAGNTSTLTNFSGTIDIVTGVFARDFTNANSINITGAVDVSANAVFGAGRGGNSTIGVLTGSGCVSTVWTGASAGSITFGNGNGSGTFSGTFRGSGNATDGNIDGGVLSIIKIGTGTQTLNGSAVSTYTGSTAVNGGTLLLDFANRATPTNLLTGTSALTLGGGNLSILGKSTSLTSQSFGSLTLTAATSSSIVLAPNGGTSTNLTLGNGWTVNPNAGLLIDLSAAGTSTVTSSPTLNNNIINPGIAVKDKTGAGFATVVGGQVVRLTAGTVVLSSSNSTAATTSTDFTTTPTDPDYSGGILTLTAEAHSANTLTIDSGAGGTLDLNANTLTFTTNGLLMGGSGNYLIQNGTVGASGSTPIINQVGTGTLTISGTMSGGLGGLTKVGPGRLTLTADNSYTGVTTISGGTLQLGDGVALTGSVAGNITNNGALVFNPGTSKSYSGTISGTGSVTKTGAGTQTLAGANTYSGATTVSAGTLLLSTSNLITTSGYTIGDVNSAGNVTLRFSGAFTSNHTGAGSVALRDIAPITVDAQTTGTPILDINTTSGSTFINGTAVLNRSVILKSTGAAGAIRAGFITFSGAGAGAGNDTIIYDATGSPAAGANWNTSEAGTTPIANTYLGNIRFTGGLTILQNKSYANAAFINLIVPDTASVSIDLGSTVQFAWGSETFDALNNGVGGGGTLSLGNNASTITIGASGGSGSFSGAIANGGGTLSLAKSGSGTQTLNGANTYTGATTIDGGVLTLGIGGTLANTSSITIATGATLNLTGGANNQLVGASQTGTLNINGTLNATTNFAHTMYFSTITMNNGTLATTISNTTAFGAFFVSANRTITANGAGNIISGSGAVGVGSGAVLTLSTPLATDVLTVSGRLGTGTSGSAGGLTKSGLGTVILSGTNGYTGITTVSAGTLQIDGNNTAANGVVNVNSTGKLSGTGTVGGAITVNSGGTLAPGDSVGTILPRSNVTILNGGNLEIQLGTSGSPGSSDKVDLSGAGGSLDFKTGSHVNLLNSGFNLTSGSGTYILATLNSGAFKLDGTTVPTNTELGRYTFGTGASGNVVIDVNPADFAAMGGASTFVLTTSGSNLVLTATAAVPEPATTGLIAAAGLAVVGFFRRRNRAATASATAVTSRA